MGSWFEQLARWFSLWGFVSFGFRLVAGACNHPNWLVILFKAELIWLSA